MTGTVVEVREPNATDQHSDPELAFVVELRPEGGEPFRVELRYDAGNEYDLYADLYPPDPGDVTGLVVHAGTGEVRFDMDDPRNSTGARILARIEAEATDRAVARGSAGTAADAPEGTNATCPTCGAPVDESATATGAAPVCSFCLEPLPFPRTPRGEQGR